MNYSMEMIETFPTIEELSDKEFHQRMVPVIYLVILLIVGIPGNLLVIFAYLFHVKPSTHRSFVLVLGIIDFLTCAIYIPFEIIEMRYQYTFYAEAACKLFRGFGTFLLLSSTAVLVALSCNRYRQVCHPLKEQLTTKQTYKLSVILMIIAFILACPDFFLVGTRYVLFTQPDNSTLIGHDCSKSDYYKKTWFPAVYDGFRLLLSVCSIVVLIILYACMGWKVRANKAKRVPNMEAKEANEMMTKKQEEKTLKNTSSVNKNPKRTAKITKIAVAISIAYICSYLPDLTLSAITSIKGRFVAKPSPIVLASLPIIARSVFINNVVNPFIYAVFDNNFRDGIKKLFQCKCILN